MKATLSNRKPSFTTSHRRESGGFYRSFQVIDLANPRTYGGPDAPAAHSCVELRLYAPGSRVYGCIWVHSEPMTTSGTGYASGYGYCKASAAAASAIRAAGIDLESRIDGVGIDAIRTALVAIARDLCKASAPVLVESYA